MTALDLGMPGLYYDSEARGGEGARITTHSMIKTMRRCPKQAEFKYVHRLKPRMLGKPLRRGTWIHSLLEEYHSGRDWMDMHRKLSHQFNQMFDEEKDYYGDMPTEILTIMRSYIWHYKDDPWKYLETEMTIEAELPDGSLYRGKMDSLVETQFGIFVVDHKSHKTLPNSTFRMLDPQSALYIWACRQNGIPVQGFIWNYLRWKAPSVPKLVANNTRLSKSPCDTDYPTYVRALKKYKEEFGLKITPEYKAEAKRLQSMRYKFGEPQHSTFFRRDVLEKDDAMLERVVKEATRTSERLHTYDFSDPDAVERVVDRSCDFSCSYTDICSVQLMGGNIRPLLKQNYKVGDPNDYYQDKAGDIPEKE
jgi:hypothetical protein